MKRKNKKPKVLPRQYLRKLKKAGRHAQVEAEYQVDEAADRAGQAVDSLSSHFQKASGSFQTNLDSAANRARDVVQELRAIDIHALTENLRKDERVESAVNILGSQMEELAGHIEELAHHVRERTAEAEKKANQPSSFVERRFPLLLGLAVVAGVGIAWATRKR